MIDPDAIDAIRAGRPGVHLSWMGRVLEATGVVFEHGDLCVKTKHLNGEEGPTLYALGSVVALERTYEESDG